MKTYMEQTASTRSRLRIFGVQDGGPANELCDNLSVVSNFSKIEFTLNTKHL